MLKIFLRGFETKNLKLGLFKTPCPHTVGAIISAGQAIFGNCVSCEELLIVARVSPVDVDSVEIGQFTEVRFTALNARTTPVMFGEVISVSGDIIESTSEPPYFRVRVKLSEKELDKISDVKLSAGMPVEVFIKTGERTALEYLVKPLTDALTHGMNEE